MPPAVLRPGRLEKMLTSKTGGIFEVETACLILQEQKQILSQRQVESLHILSMGAQELREFMIQEQN